MQRLLPNLIRDINQQRIDPSKTSLDLGQDIARTISHIKTPSTLNAGLSKKFATILNLSGAVCCETGTAVAIKSGNRRHFLNKSGVFDFFLANFDKFQTDTDYSIHALITKKHLRAIINKPSSLYPNGEFLELDATEFSAFDNRYYKPVNFEQVTANSVKPITEFRNNGYSIRELSHHIIGGRIGNPLLPYTCVLNPYLSKMYNPDSTFIFAQGDTPTEALLSASYAMNSSESHLDKHWSINPIRMHYLTIPTYYSIAAIASDNTTNKIVPYSQLFDDVTLQAISRYQFQFDIIS